MLAYNRYKKEYREYKPRNDFAIWYHGFPRLLVEIQSDNLQSDEKRLLAIAAVLLRMARANHRKETDLAKFVIVAVYMTRAHVARRLLVYLDRDEYDVPTVNYIFHVSQYCLIIDAMFRFYIPERNSPST